MNKSSDQAHSAAESESIDSSVNSSNSNSSDSRYFLLTILLITYVFNFLDRQILVILQEPIKAELGLSDTQLGLLTGFGFALIYVTMGIPIARIADKGSRRNIISAAVCTWSFFTVVCGAATNFIQLLVARTGVAVGEAGCTPPAYSMISDTFSHHERSTAFAVYNCGGSIGVLLGFLAGAWINEYFGWRMAFVAVGLPGIALAIIIRLFVAEPKRGTSHFTVVAPNSSSEANSFFDDLKFLWDLKTCRHCFYAGSLSALVTYSMIIWLPSFYIRTFELEISTVGTWFAIATGVCGAVGALAAGYLAGKLGKKDNRWYLWLVMLQNVALAALLYAILTSSSSGIALTLIIFAGFVLNIAAALLVTILHCVVPNHMRAVSVAILYFAFNIVGLGLGPVLIGFTSDILATNHGLDSLRYSLLYIVPVAALWAALHLLLSAHFLRKETIMNTAAEL